MLLPQPMARRCCSDMQRRARSEARYGPLCFSVVVVSPRDEVYGWDVLLPVWLWGTIVRNAPARQVAPRLYLERVPRLIDGAPVSHCQRGMVAAKRYPAVRGVCTMKVDHTHAYCAHRWQARPSERP